MKYTALIAAIFVLIGAGAYWWSLQPRAPKISPVATSPSTLATTTIPTSIVTKTPNSSTVQEAHQGMKLYRKDEYGFEFWYPEKWQLFIEPHGLGYYSKFEMVAAPNIAESNSNPSCIS